MTLGGTTGKKNESSVLLFFFYSTRASTQNTKTLEMSIPTSIPGQRTLEEHDPEIFDIIEHEKHRQWSGLELIASENFTSKAVMSCLGSALTNKYAERYPDTWKLSPTSQFFSMVHLCANSFDRSMGKTSRQAEMALGSGPAHAPRSSGMVQA